MTAAPIRQPGVPAPAGDNLPPPRRRVQRFKHTCSECTAAFVGPRGAEFCGQRCKDASHNRDAKRGRVMLPLAKAWRAAKSRKGDDAGKYAFAQMCALLDGWLAEDAAAGRAEPGRAVRRKMRDGWIAADQLASERRRA